jgi:hypothetical protein
MDECKLQIRDNVRLELEHLKVGIDAMCDNNAQIVSEYETLIEIAKYLLKEAEEIQQRLEEENKRLLEKHKRLTETVNRRKKLLTQIEEVLKKVEDFTCGYDDEFINAKTSFERFMIYTKKKEGIDISQAYNSFVESEKNK